MRPHFGSKITARVAVNARLIALLSVMQTVCAVALGILEERERSPFQQQPLIIDLCLTFDLSFREN